ncbi:MAG: TetR/AcrR family transcriptional regulator [Veillonella sp.]|uniref:TetR/AcrR family transcriptional regulator n=1 Tax=Veillonella sp. TaxID=1926307 RepID=UPI0025EF69F7|nr:TetR/AcrR family transcriptional regulator [Veillonella sp.]MBS4914109.1 TetR/AcrR family transcriptional regulator [Veillonella sp.]
MYTGTNPSALRSRNEIVPAFFNLLSDYSFEEITIKQIMDATGLSRQTFYQIFTDKEEILEYYLDTLFGEFMTHVKQYEVKNLCHAAKIFFAFFQEYKEIFSLIIKNGKSGVLQRKCSEYLQKSEYIRYDLHGVESDWDREYATTFVISGMVSMLEKWILSPESEKQGATELAKLVCRITGTD